MVSFNVYRATSSGAYIEGVCLASDEKPIVGISNGSILYAVDASDGTTTRYMFDQSTASWIEAECPCSGGGSSGGGGGSGALIVHLGGTPIEMTIDKTFDEIVEAANNGRSVMLFGPNGDFRSCLTSIDGGTCLFTSSAVYNGTLTATTFAVEPNNTVFSYEVHLANE